MSVGVCETEMNKPMTRLSEYLLIRRDQLRSADLCESRGRVVQVIGLIIESEGPMAGVGEICQVIHPKTKSATMCEVVGFRSHRVLLMPLGETHYICPGSIVIATGDSLKVNGGEKVLGRVLDGLGNPIDGKGPVRSAIRVSLKMRQPDVLKRQRINRRFYTGVRAIDSLIPLGCGQRVGIFAGSGVGKSTLMGMVARNSMSDVNVISLVGERIREVREFIENDLGEEGLKRSVIIAATSNEPALVRLKSAFLAMALAESFRDQGKDVLLMMDSVTRFAMAQREIGLAVGEPPATRGYTPSVFSMLPQLLERAGTGEIGSITGLFTTLVEGDDMNDPIGDTVRAILDGHIVLTRDLANQGHYPPIQILDSLSRLQGQLLNDEERQLGIHVRDCLETFRKNKDLIQVGAYQKGINPETDAKLDLVHSIDQFLRQGIHESINPDEVFQHLRKVLRTKRR